MIHANMYVSGTKKKKPRANHKSPLHKIIALRDEMKFSEVLFLPLPKHTHWFRRNYANFVFKTVFSIGIFKNTRCRSIFYVMISLKWCWEHRSQKWHSIPHKVIATSHNCLATIKCVAFACHIRMISTQEGNLRQGYGINFKKIY